MLSPGDVGDLRVLERSVRLARALRRRGERDPVRVAAGRRVLSGPTRHEEQSDHALPPGHPRGLRADGRVHHPAIRGRGVPGPPPHAGDAARPGRHPHDRDLPGRLGGRAAGGGRAGDVQPARGQAHGGGVRRRRSAAEDVARPLAGRRAAWTLRHLVPSPAGGAGGDGDQLPHHAGGPDGLLAARHDVRAFPEDESPFGADGRTTLSDHAVSSARARRIEEASLRAWPAFTDSDFDGWRLRFADGYTRRANSITPFGPSRRELDDKIATCERLYAARGLPPIFRLTPYAPPDIDGRLAARGYGLGERGEVRARPLTDIPPAPPRPPLAKLVRVAAVGLERWLDVFTALSGAAEATQAAHSRVLASVPGVRRLLVLEADERPAACGMSVFDGGLLGLFDLVTAADSRGRGFGGEILRRAQRWGQRAGDSEADLQVLDRNAVAVRLNERASFTTVYRYHYRERA